MKALPTITDFAFVDRPRLVRCDSIYYLGLLGLLVLCGPKSWRQCLLVLCGPKSWRQCLQAHAYVLVPFCKTSAVSLSSIFSICHCAYFFVVPFSPVLESIFIQFLAILFQSLAAAARLWSFPSNTMLGRGLSLLWLGLHKTNYKSASLSGGIIRGFVRILVCRGGSLSRFAICTFMATASCTSSGDLAASNPWSEGHCISVPPRARRSLASDLEYQYI